MRFINATMRVLGVHMFFLCTVSFRPTKIFMNYPTLTLFSFGMKSFPLVAKLHATGHMVVRGPRQKNSSVFDCK